MEHYDNSEVRRQDRLLGGGPAAELLAEGEYGFLAIGGEEGYGVPLNFAWDEADSIYFHCAPEGEKLRRLEKASRVAFCVVGATEPQPSKFTTLYESVLVKGRVTQVTEDAARTEALALLTRKYCPDHIDTGAKYAAKSFPRTAVLRLAIEGISGKAKTQSV